MSVGDVPGFAGAVLKHLREERSRHIDILSRGACNDFNEYKTLIGQLQALDSLEARVKQLLEYHEEDDDF